jgi:hypothetical protein
VVPDATMAKAPAKAKEVPTAPTFILVLLRMVIPFFPLWFFVAL